MAPTIDNSLEVLQARRDLAATKFETADFVVSMLAVFFGFAAMANLATFVWVSPDRLLIATTLMCAITALSIWTIGMRYVDRLELQFLRREKAIDEYLNLPVS